jgi:hypothetical protein
MDEAQARKPRNLFYLLYLVYAAVITLALFGFLGLL